MDFYRGGASTCSFDEGTPVKHRGHEENEVRSEVRVALGKHEAEG